VSHWWPVESTQYLLAFFNDGSTGCAKTTELVTENQIGVNAITTGISIAKVVPP